MDKEGMNRENMMYTDFSNVEEALKLFRKKKLLMEKIMESEEAKKEVIAKTREILKELKDMGVDGKPLSILASSLYISAILCGHARTQKEVCSAVGISEWSLRKSYRIVSQRLYDNNVIEFPIII